MFKKIKTIDDIKPFVSDRPEIRFAESPNGITIACYMFQDSETFAAPEALECRGIAFDAEGNIVSRPLHKFFNVGETESTLPQNLFKKDLVAVFEKLDGSMIATCATPDGFALKSKNSFQSDVAVWATDFVQAHTNFSDFCQDVTDRKWTAIFEYMDPRQPIVVMPDVSSLRLLHVRDNYTGDYITLDPHHEVWSLVKKHNIPLVQGFSLNVEEAMKSLEHMEDMEGYVFQFSDGTMAKAKCPWYLLRHRVVTFLREKDVAEMALHETLDDTKFFLSQQNIDLTAIEDIERRVKNDLVEMMETIDRVCAEDGHLSRKDFALKNKHLPLFGFMIKKLDGKDFDIKDFYEKRMLRERFSLDVLPKTSAIADFNVEKMSTETCKKMKL